MKKRDELLAELEAAKTLTEVKAAGERLRALPKREQQREDGVLIYAAMERVVRLTARR